MKPGKLGEYKRVGGNLITTNMKNLYFLIALLFLISCNLEGNEIVFDDTIHKEMNYQNDKELAYIWIRDRYIDQFRKLINPVITDSVIKLDEEAVKDLEKRLFKILKVSKYSTQGKINVRTLLPYADFGMLDGLTFDRDSLSIVYTSKEIFQDYFKNDRINLFEDLVPKFEDLTPKNLGDIFSAAFISDARGFNLTSFKLNSNKDYQEYGMIGAGTNGFGPILPEYLFVFVSKDNYIYMAEKELSKPFKEIDKCKTQWESIWQETQKRMDENRSSNSKNKNDIDLIDEAMDKYCDCYQKELKYDSQFETFQKQIEKIIKYIEQ